MKKLFNQLLNKQLTISFAESMTGGYLSYQISKISGASKVFKGSVVAYNKDVKNDVLKVEQETISKYSVVSKEVVIEMVEGLSKIISSDIYVAITGNAGPTLQENTNTYNVFYAIMYEQKVYVKEINFKKGLRQPNIKKTTKIITNEVLKLTA